MAYTIKFKEDTKKRLIRFGDFTEQSHIVTKHRVTNRIYTLILLILILTLYSSCKKKSSNNISIDTKTENAIPIKTIILEKKSYSFTHDFSGIIKPFNRVNLGFKIAGRIDKIYFDEGDRVVKDDILATLERDELEATVRQAEASYQKAKSSYARSKKLSDEGTISPSEIEKFEAEHKIKEAALDLARIQLKNTTLFAPFSGNLAFRSVEEKEMVLPGTSYFTIMNVSDVILEIGVPEYQIAEFYTDKKSIYQLEAFPTKEFRGEIHKVAVAADDFNKLFKVEIKIPNTYENLKPGMIALVVVEMDTFDNVYLIPLNAVMESDGGKFIFLAKDGVAVKKHLKDYQIHNENVIITELLNESNQLIVKGKQFLKNGTKIYNK